jgi:hypothetical protein
MVRGAKAVLSAMLSASAMTLVFGSGATVSAQSTSGAPPPAPLSAAKWEFEFHAGGALGNQPTGGTAIGTFPVGESFVAGVTGAPSRYASTWSFGDGARLLNQITSGFFVIPTSTRIQTLDPVLTRTGLERKRGINFGGRVSRRLTSRLTAEFNVDSVTRTVNLTDATLQGVEATRATFGPVWNAIIATGAPLFSDPSTSSTTALSDGTRVRDTYLTGTVNIDLWRRTRIVPYLTAGGGVILRSGDLPTATLTGNYQFRFVGLAPLNESDVVKVHFTSRDTAPVGVFGGGVKYALSGRQGLRVDLRIHVSRNSLDTLADAQPARLLATPSFSIPSATVPALVFSNTSATRSSLSGPAIANLRTFTGSGSDLQSSLTVGYFVRFGAVPSMRAVRAPRLAPSASSRSKSKWEIEAHAGGGFGKGTTAGTPLGAFPIGETFVAGGRPGRYASTWYFGDGALLIGQIGSGFTGTAAATTKMTPLDPVLTAASLERKHGAGAGVRLGRRLTRLLGAEFSIDTIAGSLNLTDTALRSIDATRASFTPMWNAILATGPAVFLDRNVSSNTTLRDRVGSRQTLATGAVTFELPSKGRVTPYATGGGGVMFRSGDLPSATLTGNYQFRIGTFPFNETDVARVHFTAKDRVPVGLFGGGVKYALSARQGIRADVRVHVGANSIDTLVDARPGAVLATSGIALFSGTTPPLILSNVSLPRSILTGPPISDLKTFTGSGRNIQTNVTVGYFVRF